MPPVAAPIVAALTLAFCCGAVAAPTAQTLVAGAAPPERIAVEPTSPYVVQEWTPRDGLPDGQVNAIVQTRDGYLWLGTYAGLVRFDGVRFDVFTVGSAPGVLNDRIQALREDEQGTLWIGTEARGVFMFRDGAFAVPSWNTELPDLTVLSLALAPDGALWVGTDGGAARVDVAAGHATATYTARNGLPIGTGVTTVFVARDGTAWLGVARHGLFRVDGERVQPEPIALGRPDWISGIQEDADGALWVGTKLGLFRVQDGRATPFVLPGLMATLRVAAMAADPSGGLWIGTDAGLCHLGGATTACYGERFGWSADPVVFSIGVDREGNVWVGLGPRGFYRVKRRTVGAYVPRRDGLVPDSFGPLIGDGAGGLWAGSLCTGLWHLRDGAFDQYLPAAGVPSYCIGALMRDPDGTLWLAGSAEGLIRIREGRVTVFEGAGRRINAIARDRDGVLWVGSNEAEALKRMMPDGRFVSFRLPVPGAGVQFISARRAGGLWVGTAAGLFAFEDGRVSISTGAHDLSSANVRAVIEDDDGTLWLATQGQGLLRIADGRLTRYTRANGVGDQLSWVLDDAHGHLWVSGGDGISRLSRDDLIAVAEGRSPAVSAVSYDESDGASGRQMTGGSQPAGWLAPDGKLWFSTLRGLTAIDPTAPFSTLPPPVIITGTVVDRAAPLAAELVTVPPGSHTVEVHYTGVNFSAPQKLHFQYRLDGYDPAWIDAGTRRVAYYTDLPPGHYRFDVRARSDKGIWSDTIAGVAIYQAPFFYQTRWFQALALTLLVMAAAVAYRGRIRRIVEHATRLERTVAARTSELREANAQLADGHQQLQRAHEDAVSLLNQTLLGVCVVGGDGRVAFVNAVARQVLGYSDADPIDRPWQELLPLSPEDRQRAEALLAQPAEQRTRLPVRFLSDEGREYWMELDVRDAPSDPSRRLLYLHDVTELFDLQRLLGGTAQFQGLIGETTPMRLLYRQVRDLASSDATVIIEGETGTGKELVARGIHELSARKSRPFIAVNCAALTESILTSQLFGHRRGAFTGAVSDQVGLFEAANGGTLLLDEIGDVSPPVQASLLRVLQEREITRVGESRPRPIDVRVLAATHRDLQGEVAAGRFREDLFYRLRVMHVHVPALRERQQDIPVLVAWFLGQARSAGETQACEMSRAVMDLLQAHRWPGNVRELKSVVESAAFAAQGPVIEVTDLPGGFVEGVLHADASPLPSLDARLRDHVQLALERTRGNRAAAARLLGISRNTLYRRLRELRLDVPSDQPDSGA